jgi:hypothetical protein
VKIFEISHLFFRIIYCHLITFEFQIHPESFMFLVGSTQGPYLKNFPSRSPRLSIDTLLSGR